MNSSNETLKPRTKIRRTHGDVTMREHLPIALEEVRELATCGLPTCGQCETTLRIVESMQKFVRGISHSLAADAIDSAGMTLSELADRAEAFAVLSALESRPDRTRLVPAPLGRNSFLLFSPPRAYPKLAQCKIIYSNSHLMLDSNSRLNYSLFCQGISPDAKQQFE